MYKNNLNINQSISIARYIVYCFDLDRKLEERRDKKCKGVGFKFEYYKYIEEMKIYNGRDNIDEIIKQKNNYIKDIGIENLREMANKEYV